VNGLAFLDVIFIDAQKAMAMPATSVEIVFSEAK
jgi:hypothetical protein